MNGHSPRLSHPPLGTQSISGTLAGALEHAGFPARRQSEQAEHIPGHADVDSVVMLGSGVIGGGARERCADGWRSASVACRVDGWCWW